MKGVQGFFQRWELGVSGSGPIFPTVNFFFFNLFFSFWPHRTACGILVPPTRDQTRAPCSGSVES